MASDYADFTISELREQILANATMFKPLFTVEKSRAEYEFELIMLKTPSGKHCTHLVRKNVSQKIDEDVHHGKIILQGEACSSPRRAFEAMLAKTAVILQKMTEGPKPRIVKGLPREMSSWSANGNWTL